MTLTRAARAVITMRRKRGVVELPDLRAITMGAFRRTMSRPAAIQEGLKAAKQYVEAFRTEEGKRRARDKVSKHIAEMRMAYEYTTEPSYLNEILVAKGNIWGIR